MSTMDKLAGLKEILALDPKNSFARYGIAVELANRGEVDAALAEFDQLLAKDPDYTAGYFMVRREPILPSIHSMWASASQRARLVTRL